MKAWVEGGACLSCPASGWGGEQLKERDSIEAEEKGAEEGCVRTHPQRHWEAGVSGRNEK